ncbi:DUF4190 domain-containing protein [Kocuria soli]|nr:DUF4190 domain-containing protein [Kocuria soli]
MRTTGFIVLIAAVPTLIVLVVVAGVWSLVQSTWQPLLWAAIAFPTLSASLAGAVVIKLIRSGRASQLSDVNRLRSLYGPGPMAVEVYDRALRLIRPGGTAVTFSGIRAVKGMEDDVYLDLPRGGFGKLPRGIAAAEVSHLAGEPPVLLPSDGGPEAQSRTTAEWAREQRSALPPDKAHQRIALALTRREKDDRDVVTAARYDAERRLVVYPRDGAAFSIDLISKVTARAGIVMLEDHELVTDVLPVQAWPEGHLRAMFNELGDKRCDVDLALNGSQLLMGAALKREGAKQRRRSKPPRNRLATVALALSIVGLPGGALFSLFGLWFGALAYRQNRRAEIFLLGTGRAVAAMMISVIGLMIFVVWFFSLE